MVSLVESTSIFWSERCRVPKEWTDNTKMCTEGPVLIVCVDQRDDNDTSRAVQQPTSRCLHEPNLMYEFRE